MVRCEWCKRVFKRGSIRQVAFPPRYPAEYICGECYPAYDAHVKAWAKAAVEELLANTHVLESVSGKEVSE